jgi:hypothetical protein
VFPARNIKVPVGVIVARREGGKKVRAEGSEDTIRVILNLTLITVS